MPRLFGQKLRFVRLRFGLSQAELAQRLELGQSQISHLEQGRGAPSLEVVLRAADVLSVTCDYLLRDAVPIDPPIAAVVPARPLSPARFGQHLRRLREYHGLAQAELARQLMGFSRPYIVVVEGRRKAPSIDLLIAVADLFGVPVDQLLHDDE